MKKILTVVVIIVLTFAFLAAVKNTIAKIAVEKGVEVVAGLQMKMRALNIGLIKTVVDIKGLRIFNPPTFPDKVMLDAPEIYVDYDLGDIIKGKIHLKELRINVKEFIAVKKKDGELNLNSLRVVKDSSGRKEEKPSQGSAMPEVQIDTLSLKIGKVIYKDYSAGGEPSVKEFDINIDESHQDVDDPEKLVSLIVISALRKTAIARLTNFDLGNLEGIMSETIKLATTTASSATAATQEVVKDTANVLKGTAAGLENVIKLPFVGAKEE